MRYLRYYAAVVLLVTGLFGFKLLFASGSPAEATTATSRCAEVNTAAGTLQSQFKDANGNAGLQRQLMTTIGHLIINDQQCFPADAVAAMQTFLDH